MRLKEGNNGRSTRMSSSLAYGERYSAGRGFGRSFSAGVSVGAGFGQHLCWCYSIQADEHLRGHPYVLCRRQCRSKTPGFNVSSCLRTVRPNLSAARSVGECLNGIVIFGMCTCRHTHVGWGHEYMRRHDRSCKHLSWCLSGSRFFLLGSTVVFNCLYGFYWGP